MHRGSQAEHEACNQAGAGGKSQHPTVDMQIAQPGNRAVAAGNHKSPGSERQQNTQDSTDDGKKNALRQELRIRRARLPPSAERTAISFWRETARDNSNPATLAQAISRTAKTAPHDTSRLRRALPTVSSCRPTSRMPPNIPYCLSRPSAMVLISAWACCKLAPGCKRPTEWRP